MNKHLFNLVVIGLFLSNIQAQSFWKKQVESRIASRQGDQRTVIPEKYEVFQLDKAGLRSYLRNAPLEFTTAKGLTLEVPMTDGRTELFEVFESPAMQSGISAKYPSIKSYKAIGITDKTKNMRFSMADNGFYAAINTLEGEKYIDPYSEKNTDDYIVYNVKDHHSDIYKNTPMCGVSDEIRPSSHHFTPIGSRTGLVDLRVFKLAMACTGEWGQVARRGTVEKCLADINVMLNRMNSIYEKEMAMRFVLIDNNDKLIFLDPNTDPYTDSDKGKSILGTNTSVIANQGITSSSYDVGHVLSICFDIGGVAQGGSACQSNKGNGVTCNNDNDLTNIVTRVMAHEIGHQFDASHTWNICQPDDPSIDAQRAGGFAYEPGSGTTIMSYAGSCNSDNVMPNNDDYFHVGSLTQMYSKTYTGGNAFACSDKIATTNHFPEIQMPNTQFTIPISTPFVLTANATDEDGDVLTYCWEQYDLGPKVSLGTNGSEGPLFRSYKPSTTGNQRFFPKNSDITSGANNKVEVLPNVSRELTFQLTVRDNNSQGAGVVSSKYSVNVSDLAGPFKLTFPYLDSKFTIGQEINVTWSVNNTDKAPVNCKKVNIYGSYSSALADNDPNLIPLVLNVDNDGSEKVYIPNRVSTSFRIVVKAADNIFLTTGVIASRVNEPTVPSIFFDATEKHINICQPDPGIINFITNGYAGYSGEIEFDILSTLPSGVIGSFKSNKINAGETNQFTINTSGVNGDQTGSLIIRAIAPGVDTMIRTVTYAIIGSNLNNIEASTPAPGASNISSLPKFIWNTISDAKRYELQVSTSPDFSSGNIINNNQLTKSEFTTNVILNKSTIYYWRVRAINDCKAGNWSKINAFSTEASACKVFESGVQSIAISTAGTPIVELPLDINTQGIISDLNIKLIRAEHAKLADIVAYLVSPSGKEALLWSRQCAAQQNIKVGLDDQSPNFFTCPINTGNIYRTHVANGAQKLEIFNGEQMSGTWKLRLEDKQSGSGGKLQELNLEICSNITVENPTLVKNDPLKLAPNDKQFITDVLLLATDNSASASELIYTLVEAPANGKLTLNGLDITPGAKFSQADINSSKLRYESNLNENGEDAFTFTIIDGQGGWINITKFNILVDKSIDVKEIYLNQDVFVFPNPTTSEINIVLSGNATILKQYEVTDITGRKVLSGNLTNNTGIVNLSTLYNGTYFIRLTNGKQSVSKKLIKI